MTAALMAESQIAFYREWLMGRATFDPAVYGLDLDRAEIIDRICGDFNEKFRTRTTIDEVLLHPRTAVLGL